MTDPKNAPLREEACLTWLKIHAEKVSFWYPAPCQCPWCRKARRILREREKQNREE